MKKKDNVHYTKEEVLDILSAVFSDPKMKDKKNLLEQVQAFAKAIDSNSSLEEFDREAATLDVMLLMFIAANPRELPVSVMRLEKLMRDIIPVNKGVGWYYVNAWNLF
ncbi:hypothetical protein Q2T76_01605 [Lactobacillus sp. YT155]|uniref:hypothetical protein n=1 Tax=Lactobacillus sp. YT155 TaxID=3060955 RepID=UPI00265D690F|nr:hypothetical protein [Lactobacillus sp. YT155]MDO1604747.1 hypothetical protein [Lactobacillus sp. YT155]